MKTLALHDFDEALTGFGGAGLTDYCSREGAVRLKETIEAYWRERGQTVMIALHNVGFHPAIRAARFDVRSDMINGMPRCRDGAQPARASEDVYLEDFEDGDISFE